MAFSKIEKVPLGLFLIFVFTFEFIHVKLNGAPPMSYRMIYIFIYLMFCFFKIRLIPIFTAVNLIVERFSIEYGEYLPNNIYFHIAILFLCFFCIKQQDTPSFKYCTNKELVPMVLFCFYVFINSCFYGNFSTFNSLIFAFIYIIVLSYSRKEYIKTLFNCLIIAMSFSCILSFLNYDAIIANNVASSNDLQRMVAWKDSNYLSFFIGIIIMLSLFKIKYLKSKPETYFYTAIVIILTISLTLLISRGSAVALIVGCLYYYRKSIFSHKIIGYLFILLFLGAVFYSTGLLDGFIMRFNSESIESGSGRTNIWKAGFDTFFDKGTATILFGAGDNQAAKMALLGGIYFSPHNNFIEILFSFGYLGLTLFSIWWLSLLFNSKSIEKKALIIFILTNSMTIVPLSYVMPVWIIIPLLMIWDNYLQNFLHE